MTFFQNNFATDEDAFNEVKRGRAWGAMIFSQNYSESLVQRTEEGRDATDWVLESSAVDVRIDMSSKCLNSFEFLICNNKSPILACRSTDWNLTVSRYSVCIL